MATSSSKKRVSRHFSLGRDQTTLDFVDIPIGSDIPVFLDPSRIRAMGTTWSRECESLLQHFFQRLLDLIRRSDRASGLLMLEGLSERNEFHLGFSKGMSQGSGIGSKFALIFWNALNKSKAGKTGLLHDFEDACLFIEGVGPDRISDAVCNILRGPLIRYTQDMCRYYGIPLTKDVDSGPLWNPQSECWENSLVELPATSYGKILLVPKTAVRHKFSYDYQNYYTHYLLPGMQEHEKSLNSALVLVLRDGRKKVTKKSLREKYGVDKLAVANQTIKHPDILTQYKKDVIRTSSPLTHYEFSEIENIDIPRFDRILKNAIDIKPGRKEATSYENAIEALLSAVFFPSLTYPTKQDVIHDGRKRIDITYTNIARDGFFNWLALNYSAANIFVECKNYGEEIANPEVDQLAGRFGPSRGVVGILICRSVKNENLLFERCRDTAKDNRGFIIHLTDEDLKKVVQDYVDSDGKSDYPVLRKKFRSLIM
ncbi:hypothetical protein IMZ29_22160 [Achromobacter sp. GG226]|uniref:hypothetical protein n=1 Tax=Verticiella alkaliphila TaxID=2779529 RepID=UPI001C0E33D6|nr:hypothetical protein [Verticiella sp. GG226]MBU4613143.1 hypothetical protein [Verticiella sp. GG226]